MFWLGSSTDFISILTRFLCLSILVSWQSKLLQSLNLTSSLVRLCYDLARQEECLTVVGGTLKLHSKFKQGFYSNIDMVFLLKVKDNSSSLHRQKKIPVPTSRSGI